MPDAYAEFVDQKRGYGCTYTLELGSSPGVARISAPSDFGRVNDVGPLELHFRRTMLRLNECRLVAPVSPSSTTEAPAVNWTVEDRRWKWQYGDALDGDYNRELKNGKLVREKSPRELAQIIFAALGESDANVSALPSKPRPPRFWRAAGPREELDRLCQEFDCAPGYNPWTDKAYIVKLGKGTAPPRGEAHKSRADAKTSPPIPDAIEITGGNTLYQSALELGDSLALEVDGTYVSAETVSYKPPGGWMPFVLGGKTYFANLNTTYVDKATGRTLYHRDLAEASVFRCFRITGQVAGGFSPLELKGTDYEPKSLKDLGPFTGTVLDKDPLTGARMPAYVRGVYLDPKSLGNRNTQPGTRYDGSVSINNDLRIVTFDKPIFKLTVTPIGIIAEVADDMELVAAYEVTSEGVPLYYSRTSKLRGKTYGAGNFRESVDSIVREVIEKTASASGKATDNKTDCHKQADYYLDELRTKFVKRPASQIAYSGILKFVPDGLLRSVTWSFSTTSTPETTVAWDCERSHYITPWEQKPEAIARRQIDAAIRKANGAQARAESRDRAQRNVTI